MRDRTSLVGAERYRAARFSTGGALAFDFVFDLVEGDSFLFRDVGGGGEDMTIPHKSRPTG